MRRTCGADALEALGANRSFFFDGTEAVLLARHGHTVRGGRWRVCLCAAPCDPDDPAAFSAQASAQSLEHGRLNPS